MHTDSHAELAGGLPDPKTFVEREAHRVAADVAVFRKTRGLRKEIDHEVEILVPAAGIFGRQHVRPEIGGDDLDRMIEPRCQPQQAQFGCAIESVAGFRLERRRAVLQHGVEIGQRLADQIVVGRIARVADGIVDAALQPGRSA
jgi:hypothetical protein